MNKKNKPYFNLIQLDLTTKYDELLRVNCRHNYFSNKGLAGIRLEPTEETATTLKRLQMLFRRDWLGFSLGYGSQRNYVPIELIDKPVRLSFWLFLEDNYFYNYTKIPYEVNAPMIYYFSNNPEDKSVVDEKFLFLSKGRAITGEDRIAIQPTSFTYEFEDTIFDETLVQVIDSAGEVYFEETVEEFAMDVNINLYDAPAGKYSVKVGEEIEKSFYVYPSDLRRIFGVIDIVLDPNDPSPYSLYDSGKAIKQEYNMFFDSRAIYWKYLVVEQAKNKIHSDFKITDAGRVGRRGETPAKVNFTKAEEVELETGQLAMMLCSEQAIPMQEKQAEKFKLKTKRGKNKVEHLTELPSPSVQSTMKMGENDELLSEIVVYL